MQLSKQQIAYCMECGVCTGSCPVKIDFPAFIRTYRKKARQEGSLPKLNNHL